MAPPRSSSMEAVRCCKGWKRKYFTPALAPKGLHDFFPITERPCHFSPCFTAPITVPEYIGNSGIPLIVPQTENPVKLCNHWNIPRFTVPPFYGSTGLHISPQNQYPPMSYRWSPPYGLLLSTDNPLRICCADYPDNIFPITQPIYFLVYKYRSYAVEIITSWFIWIAIVALHNSIH